MPINIIAVTILSSLCLLAGACPAKTIVGTTACVANIDCTGDQVCVAGQCIEAAHDVDAATDGSPEVSLADAAPDLSLGPDMVGDASVPVDAEVHSDADSDADSEQSPSPLTCQQAAAVGSGFGCDFFAADLDNALISGGPEGVFDAANAQYAIVVSVPAAGADATVQVWQMGESGEELVPFDSSGAALPSGPLAAGQTRVYKLLPRNVDGTVQAALAYRVTSSAPVGVHQFNPFEQDEAFSADGSLLLPVHAAGNKHIAMSGEQTFDVLRGFLTVVAVQPGATQVVVTVTAKTQAGTVHPGQPSETEIPAMGAGDTRAFTLQQYEVLNLETGGPGQDLTGSQVTSDKAVTVFGGAEGANAPNTARCVEVDPVTGEGVCETDPTETCYDAMDCVAAGLATCCADHLEVQLPPVAAWGTHIVATKAYARGGEADVWRFLAAQNGTQVTLNPAQEGISVMSLDAGEWFELESVGDFQVTTIGKPILVAQILAGQDAPGPNLGVAQPNDAGIGDPAMWVLTPVEEYAMELVTFTPAEYAASYINIVVPAGGTVQLDGEEVTPDEIQPIGDSGYSVIRQQLDTPGLHTITATAPVGAVVYGWDDFVAYGYAAGATQNSP